MSLGTRLTLKTAVLVLAVLVVAAVSLWGLGGLNRDLDAALVEYDRLQEAYILLSELERSRLASRSTPPNRNAVLDPLERVQIRLSFEPKPLSHQTEQAVFNNAGMAIDALTDPFREDDAAAVMQAVARINTAINVLAAELTDIEDRIDRIDREANERRKRVVVWVAVTATLAALLAIVVGVWQYLAVMRPLKRLQRGVERLASGDFADRLGATGDREFVHLADDFNRMADELSALYRDLEDKVRLRSAQLAQSERLASVGFLAAGVAHEINNPLAIIAGEAELALSALPADADEASRKALSDIRDEAFRCKGITQKLLSLSRPGSGEREPVALKALAEEVASLVRTLEQHAGRSLTVEGDPQATATTVASQVKQVLLNLVINALEAVEPGVGRVRIAVTHRAGVATLAVYDNGKGMDKQVLGRVFEPFYTEKKSPTTPGLGLGLSISHAIIEDLGGRLTASSEGVGRGSTFTIELPIDSPS